LEFIRKIVISATNKIVITIPDHFIGKRIEVLASEIEEDLLFEEQKIKRPFIVVNAKVERYKFDRDEANER